MNINITKEDYKFLIQILNEYRNIELLKKFLGVEFKEENEDIKYCYIIEKIIRRGIDKIKNEKEEKELRNLIDTNTKYSNKSLIELCEKLEENKEALKIMKDYFRTLIY